MNLNSQIILGGEYVSRQLSTSPPDGLFLKMWASSLLLTLSEKFEHKAFRKVAETTLDKVGELVYQQNDRKLIVVDGKSKTVWDAMYVHCLLKLGRSDEAISYCKGISMLEAHRDYNGIPVVVYLEVYDISQDSSFLDWAVKANDILIEAERISLFDAWGLALIGKRMGGIVRMIKNKQAGTNLKMWAESHLLQMLSMSHINPHHMIGIIGPMFLQICLAYQYLTGHNSFNGKAQEIIESRYILQITPENHYNQPDDSWGAFIKSRVDSERRIDYTLATVFGFLQCMFPIEPKVLF